MEVIEIGSARSSGPGVAKGKLKVADLPDGLPMEIPVIIVRGKAPKDMRNKEDFWEVLDIVPGEPLMQKPDAFGCKLGDYT